MSNFDGRFHRDVWWPNFIKMPHMIKLTGLIATEHVKEQVQKRCPQIRQIPKAISVAREEIVECTIKGGKCIAILFRKTFNSEYDIIYIVNPSNRRIVTVWLNRKTDKHSTLKRELYRAA